ncbi:MAG: aminotransferase class I/II-fold pyridoxal phosphate-dependent enzyme [Clostridiales bacterium]|nr:aminotransferase class I/II-fold pyridoxal phosphate-dependent enzyme [Clostridiales bacterium]
MSAEKWVNPVVKAVPPSGIRQFFDIVNEIEGAVSLGVGEPDFVTPWRMREAAIWSLEQGETHYTSNWGTPELRGAIAQYLRTRFALEYNPAREILVTIGASEGIDLALRTILRPGDEVLIPDPSYVSYAPCVMLAGGVPVGVRTGADEGFRMVPQAVRDALTPRSRAIILPYPNNPTGAVMERADLAALSEAVAEADLAVISDEIYGELTYTGDRHVSIAELPGMRERTILLSGFSKSFAMTGWRLGYACGPDEIMAAMVKIHQYTALCAPIMAQRAALEGLRFGLTDDFSEVASMRRSYNRRRRVIVEAFNKMGLPCFEPLGAFYAFPCIRPTGMTSQQFCETLLREQKLALVPGTAFGPSGEGFVRASYAYSMGVIQEAMARLRAFLADHGVAP